MMIESPCTKICTLDQRTGLCIGCGRTLYEIAHWSGMTSEERVRIMRGLGERLAKLKQKASH